MSARARIIALLSVAALGVVCVLAACKNDHCSDANGCTLSDDDLQSCANVDTGIYGVATSCESRVGCDPSTFGTCSSLDIVALPPGVTPGMQVGLDAGPSVVSANGHYAMSLSPGDYYACCTSSGTVTIQTCAIAHVESGEKVRVDAKLVASIGQVSCTMTAR